MHQCIHCQYSQTRVSVITVAKLHITFSPDRKLRAQIHIIHNCQNYALCTENYAISKTNTLLYTPDSTSRMH